MFVGLRKQRSKISIKILCIFSKRFSKICLIAYDLLKQIFNITEKSSPIIFRNLLLTNQIMPEEQRVLAFIFRKDLVTDAQFFTIIAL